MKISKMYKLISLVGLGLFASSASATVSYISEGGLTLEVTGVTDTNSGQQYDFFDLPSGIDISYFSDEGGYSGIFGDAYSDTVPTGFSDLGYLLIDAQVSGYAATPYAFSEAGADSLAEFYFENNTDEDYFVEMLVSYSYSGSVETDDPSALQNAMSAMFIELSGDFNLGQIVSVSEIIDFSGSAFSGFADFTLGFQLDSFDFETVNAYIAAQGEAELLPSQIPSPATILLVAPALLGLARQKKSAV